MPRFQYRCQAALRCVMTRSVLISLIGLTVVLIASPPTRADTYYSDYGQSRTHNIPVTIGSHNFQVNGIAANKNTEWYVDGAYTGSSENDWSGLLAIDPEYTKYVSTSVQIEALVYDRYWNYEEYHTWNVSIARPDLRITAMQLANSTASDQHFSPGQAIRLDFQGYNGGNAASKPSVKMNWYYGTSSYAKTNPIDYGYLGTINGLSVGEYEWETDASWNVPTTPGTYWLTAVIDSDNNNSESKEDNNEATIRFIVDPPTGSVQVTIEPAGARNAGAQWRLTGSGSPDTGWKSSGVTIPNVPVGNYTVEYSSLSGWTKPDNQSIIVSKDSTATRTGTYIQHFGSVRVTIEPANARTAGAQWRLTGSGSPDTGWKSSGVTISNVPVGSYTVEYSSLSGWTKPDNQSIIVSKDSTATGTGTYRQIVSAYWWDPLDVTEGTVATMCAEVEGFSIGEQFTFELFENDAPLGRDPVPPNRTGAVYVSGGKYYVKAEWTTIWQSDQSGDPEFVFDVSNGAVKKTSRNELIVRRAVGSVQVTIEPANARTAGAQWRLTGSGSPDTGWKSSGVTISNVPVGNYTVEYSSLSGWTKPDNQSIIVSKDSTTTRTGTYSVPNEPPSNPGVPRGSNITSNSVRIDWLPSNDPEGHAITYTVEYKPDWSWTWASTTTSSTFKDLSGLESDRWYDVRVMACDSEGLCSSWSSPEENIFRTCPLNNQNRFPVVEGWFPGDTHVHSNLSIDTHFWGLFGVPTTVQQLGDYARTAGLKWMVITDHSNVVMSPAAIEFFGMNLYQMDDFVLGETAASAYRQQHSDFMLIYSQELGVHMADPDNRVPVHILAYPQPQTTSTGNIYNFSDGLYIGFKDCETYDTIHDRIQYSNSGFDIIAHPFKGKQQIVNYDYEFTYNPWDYDWGTTSGYAGLEIWSQYNGEFETEDQQAVDTWYALLNAIASPQYGSLALRSGFPNAFPVGLGASDAHCGCDVGRTATICWLGSGVPLTWANISQAILDGHCIASNGPLGYVTIKGKRPGEVASVKQGTNQVDVRLHTTQALGDVRGYQVQIYVNGAVRNTVQFTEAQPNTFQITKSVTLTIGADDKFVTSHTRLIGTSSPELPRAISNPIWLDQTRYYLAYTVTPQGSGTITVNPLPDSDGMYTGDTIVQLTANAAPGYTFSYWSLNATGSSNPANVVMLGSDKGVIANFGLQPDTTNPTLAISSPTNGQSFSTSPITVDGTASDPGSPSSGVALVEVRVNGGSWQSATGTTSWSKAGVALSSGSNTIEARSKDNAGNYSTIASVIVTYNPPDTTNPTVAINSPTNGQTFTASPITADGTASDPGSPSSGVALVEVRVNGGSWQSATGTTSWSKAGVALSSGSNTIEARSKDNAGRYSTIESVNVTYNPPDTTPPTVTITSPTDGQTFTTSSITASGGANDPGWEPSPNIMRVEVRLNFGPWMIADQSVGIPEIYAWSKALVLVPGSNKIEARSKDSAGNYSPIDSVNVTYTPLITWYHDADGDGYGNLNESTQSPTQPDDYVADNTDCNDGDNTIYPGAPELCDGKDNDCDGQVDENIPIWYPDTDDDGFGDKNNGKSSAVCSGSGWQRRELAGGQISF